MLPKAYHASLRWKILLIAIGTPLGIGGLAGTWYFGSGHEVSGTSELYLLTGTSLFFALLGLYCAIYPLRATLLVLRADALVVPGLFKETLIAKRQIEGYRFFVNQGVKVLQVHYKRDDGAMKKKDVTLLFEPDEVLAEWFDAIPDIDAVAYAAEEKEVLSDERLGATPEARHRHIERARKIGGVLTNAGLGVMGWAIFYPTPYQPMFLALTALPIIALLLCWRYEGFFSIDDRGGKSARADLTLLLIAPGFVLALRALFDLNMIDATQLLVPSAVGLAIVVAAIVYVAPIYRRSVAKLLLITALMSAYPAATIALANAIYDTAPYEQHLLTVLGKRTSGSKSTSYYLKFDPWDAASAVDEVQVTEEEYRQTAVGEAICIQVNSGALGFGWYLAQAAQQCTAGAAE